MSRVSVATLRRLEVLEKPSAVQRGGLLQVPRVLGLDEWQAQAHAWHDRLMQSMQAEQQPGPVIVGADPQDVSHQYRKATIHPVIR